MRSTTGANNRKMGDPMQANVASAVRGSGCSFLKTLIIRMDVSAIPMVYEYVDKIACSLKKSVPSAQNNDVAIAGLGRRLLGVFLV